MAMSAVSLPGVEIMSEPFYLTPSRIASALSCPLRYYRQYVAKIPGGKLALSTFVGSRQHDTLEAWANQANLWTSYEEAWRREAPQSFGPLLTQHLKLRTERVVLDEAMLAVADEIRAKRPEIKAVERTSEYKAAIEPGLKKIERAAGILGNKLSKWVESEENPWNVKTVSPLQAFDDGMTDLERFERWFFDLGENRPSILHTETKQRDIILGDDEFTLTGVIDAIYLWPNDITEVVDYKRSAGSDGDLNHFASAVTYSLTCAAIIGYPPDRVTFHHLKEGSRTSYEVKDTWPEKLLDLCRRVQRMHEFNEFGPSFRTCSWCDYQRLCFEGFDFEPIREEEAA